MSSELSFAALDPLLLFGTLVYRVRRGERVLYVGMSTKGIERFLALQHPCRHLIRDRSVVVEILRCESPEEAARIEMEEIHRLHPMMNQICRVCVFAESALRVAAAKVKAREDAERRQVARAEESSRQADRLVAAFLRQEVDARTSS